MSLKVSDFSLFFKKKLCLPTWKKLPLFPSNTPLKMKILPSPPPSPPSFLKFDKFGSSLNPPLLPADRDGGCTLCNYLFWFNKIFIFGSQSNHSITFYVFRQFSIKPFLFIYRQSIPKYVFSFSAPLQILICFLSLFV